MGSEKNKSMVSSSVVGSRAHEIGPDVIQRASVKQRQRISKANLDTAELTVDCVLGEMLHGGTRTNRPTMDAQLYLQRRVSEIVKQIESTSSAHHFCRHVVEIDELLRCDAPMGFTPSMVLVGIPDILYMLSDAVKQGYLLYPAEENGAVQALSPVRKSPITKTSIAAKTATTTALQTATTATVLPATAPPGGNRAERKQHGRSLGSPRNSARSKLKGGAVKDDMSSTDLLPFLPPLVRRPVSPPQEQQRSETMPHGNARDGVADSAADVTTTTTTTTTAGGAPAAAAVIASSSDPCRHTTPRIHSRDKLSGAPLVGKGQLNHKSLRSHKEGRTGKQLGGTNSGMALPQYSSSPTGTVERQQLVVQYDQGLDENPSSSHVPLLRDIPSALQALLYHCALPLVCLTPEDHQQRTTAIRILASAMASMLRITENSVPENSIKTPPSNENGITDKKEEKDTSDMVEDDRENNDNKVASRLPFQEISFRIRYAALMSLNALMGLIDSEELTCVNQHFASRDRVRYEKSDAATLPHTPERNYLTPSQKKSGYQKKSTHEKEIPLHSNSEKTITGSSPTRVFRLTDPFLSTPQRSPRRGRAHPTFPVSIYNGAVAVDVFIPLLERWTDILQDCVAGDALFDSSRQFFRHPAIEEAEAAEEKKRNENNNKKQNTIIVLDMDLNEDRNNHHSTKKKMGGFTVSVSKTPMDEKTAEEVYLLLCACLHLSTYKQHARYLIGPDKGPDSTYKSLPVLLSLTMARCAEGDKSLSLCVECLWNLLEIAPEETVGALLHHTTTTSDDSSGRTKNGENEKSRKERTLSSLSAMESLLFSFLHTLMLGHRLRQREVRNDMVVLFMMILKTHTTVLKNRQEMVQNSSDFEAVTFQVPESTIYAINVIARTIFDLVCGPELRVYGITAKTTREPVETFLRYHSALCPTTRVENVQFKLLSWRMLETFYQWQNARLTLENVCRECQGTRTNSRRVDASENSGLVDGTVNYNDDDCDSLFFDVCSHGFIDVLLLYVDTTCSDELVVTWTREELFTLQEEVWYILLGLIESAVMPSSSSFQESNNNNNNNSCSSSMRKRNVDGMSLMTNSDRSKENTMNDNSNGKLPLVRADIQFVASRGIPCALRYIREVTAKDADDLVCLAVRVLSVLSRCPSYRSQLLDSTVPTAPSASSYNENVPCIMEVILQVIQNCLQKRPPPTEVMNLYTWTNLVKTSEGSNFSSQVSHVTTITSTQSGSTANNNNNNNSGSQVAIRNKKSKGLQQKPHDDPLTQLPSTQGGLKCIFESNSCSENKFLTAREYDVIMYCLSLLNNIANDNSYDISLMHQSFVSLGGVPLLISMAQISLSLLTLALQSPLKGNNSRNGLLFSVLDSFRAFILGNEVAQKQFVYEDGVHVILSAILTLESRWKNDYLNVLNGNTADSNSPLAFMLTILADLLRESEEAQEDFLKWSTHELSMSMGMEDNTCTNATQLLLRMWIEKEEEIEGDEKGMTCNGEIEYEQNGEHDEFDSATGNESEGTKNGARPILHADRWGLGLLGIRHRDSVIAELQNRYNELEYTDLDAADDRTARDETTQLARHRLAVSLQNILGMHAKVYACLAAIGFDRLISVKTTPPERVKLLHVAALPSLCEDEVWGAMAETVNLRGLAVVLPMRRNEKKQVNGAAKDDKEEDDEGASKEKFVVDPIIPDATQLVKVLLDVEARTMELQHLAKICIDTHAAHQSEITQRFLLSRLKLGSGDTSVMTLVQHARSRHDPVSTGEGGSILDHVMSRTGQSGVERIDIPSAFSTTPTGTAMVDTGKFFSSRMTLLEKKRKRNDMIQKSFRESQGGVVKGSNTVKTDM